MSTVFAYAYPFVCCTYHISKYIYRSVCKLSFFFFFFEMCLHQKPSAYNGRWLKGCCSIEHTPFGLCDKMLIRISSFLLNLGICVCVSQRNVDDFLRIFHTLCTLSVVTFFFERIQILISTGLQFPSIYSIANPSAFLHTPTHMHNDRVKSFTYTHTHTHQSRFTCKHTNRFIECKCIHDAVALKAIEHEPTDIHVVAVCVVERKRVRSRLV